METVYTRFLESYMPASVILNEQNEVIHFFGSCLDYMSIAPGKASFNLFGILNKDVSLAASTALSRCRAEHTSVTYKMCIRDSPGFGFVQLPGGADG